MELLRGRVVAGLVHADVPPERARMVQVVRIKLRWIILEMWGGWKYGSGSGTIKTEGCARWEYYWKILTTYGRDITIK